MSWPTTSDGLWYIFDGQVLIPVSPETGAPILMLRPQGGMGVGIPAIADGEPGPAATFQEGPVTFTELAHDDPTPASLSVTQVSPGVYALSGALHKGGPGEDGTSAIDMDSIGGTPTADQLIKVNGTADGFDYAFEKVAERYVPATINNTTAGNTTSTLATIPIPNKHFAYRIIVQGQTIVTQNGGSNVVVNLRARLNDQTGGNIIAETPGLGGTERLSFSSVPPAGVADSFDKVIVEFGT